MELMRPATAKLVTDNCPAIKTVMPLYIEDGKLTSPFCCHGNNLDCDRCGTWVMFAHAAKLPGPWDEILPSTKPYGPLADHLRRAFGAGIDSGAGIPGRFSTAAARRYCPRLRGR